MKERIEAVAEAGQKEGPEMKNGTDKDHEHSFGVREGEVTPTHLVLGLFISARLHDICASLVPSCSTLCTALEP